VLPDLFEQLEHAARSHGPAAAFDLLLHSAREQKNYPLLFEARLLQKRHELGLPLLHSGDIGDLPPDKQSAYQEALASAARETGSLFLADGDIVRAWPYLRAVGEPEPVAAAIEALDNSDNLEAVLEIALGEGVNPRKGFDLLIAHHGLCRAIEFTLRTPDRPLRVQFLERLVRAQHAELVKNLRGAISEKEGAPPATASLSALMENRDWLFEGGRYYTENSHLASILQASPELEDPEAIRLALELADYALRLDPIYRFPGTAPFENLYEDHATYLRAVLGEDVDAAVAHFRGKPEAAAVLIPLLSGLGRYREAMELALECGAKVEALELCQRAADYDRLRELAREQNNPLAFTAGLLGLS
jgi:hypothetical protein